MERAPWQPSPMIPPHPTAASASINAMEQSAPSQRSTFKTCLKDVPVPEKLMEGVGVIKVNTKGRTKRGFLTLSEDKFTLYVTSSKVRNGSATSGSLLRPILLKVKSIGSADSAATYEEEYNDERAIDIGSIDRIQRGQNTLKFELARNRSGNNSINSTSTITSTTSSISPRKGGGGSSLRSNGGSGSTIVPLDPNRSFSIIFRGERTLDLMTEGDDYIERDDVLNALDNLICAYQNAKTKVGNDVLLLRYIWLDVDKDKSNTINSTELSAILTRINFYMNRKQLTDLYHKFGKTIGLERKERSRGYTFEQTVTFLHKIKRDTWQVKPVNQIWIDLFGEFMKNGKPRMTVSDRTFLDKFLHKKQHQYDATIDDVRSLFHRLNELEIAHVARLDVTDPNSDCVRIDKDRFEAYLVSRENDVFDPKRERFDISSMNKPLPEYWINTSHNTYLEGDQWSSRSSVEMYMRALYRGCRCVELDIWDGEGREPIVYHGHTMTTKIPFSDIVHCIKVFLNFNPDSFPIILSLENHCSIPQQEIMAENFTSILGDLLYVPEDGSLSKPLPSPSRLRGRVVLKGRRPDHGLTDEDETDDDTDDEEIPLQQSEEQQQARKVQSNRIQIAPQLARLTLFHGTKFRTWEESLLNPFHHMHSFSESKVRATCRQQKAKQWTTYNQRHMTRTFPSGKRVDSSNYNPMLAWSTGCQLVALNFQTPDFPLRINDGRFRENGNCGYVLKPKSLMSKPQTNNDNNPSTVDRLSTLESSLPVKLSVRVLSASCLPKPKGQKRGECIDPYVKVSVHDVTSNDGPIRDVVTTYTTNVVSSNGFFPIWNQDKFTFRIENYDVAMLQLNVWDKDVGQKDDFIASAAVPISCLREGIRSVQLFDLNNTRSGAFDFASLLIEVKMKRLAEEI